MGLRMLRQHALPGRAMTRARISNIIAQVCIASMASKWRTQKWNVVTPFCLSPP